MYQRIFVPFDGSDCSLCGLDEALGLARLSGARLRVAYEIDELTGATGFESYAIYARDVLAAMRRNGEGILAIARERASQAGIAADTELFESGGHDIAARLVEHADAWKADLIVIGSHGRRGAARLFMGSDAEHMLRLAAVPVLVVRCRHDAQHAGAAHRQADPARQTPMYQRILVPVDGSATSLAGLAEAIGIGRLTGATLRLFQVLDLRPYATGFDGGTACTDELMREIRTGGEAVLAAAAARVEAAGLKHESRVLETFSARASDMIVDEAAACGAELIVIGTHGRRGISRLVLGSDAEQVLRQSPAPVLLVRGRPETGQD